MTTIQDVLDAIVAAGVADCWDLADEIATEHGITGCRMCLVAERPHAAQLPPSGYRQPFEELFCRPCLQKYLDRHQQIHTVKIYARPDGDDATGNGSLKNPYRTFVRAQRDIPRHIPSGYRYDIDITGIADEADASEEASAYGLQALPTGIRTPSNVA